MGTYVGGYPVRRPPRIQSRFHDAVSVTRFVGSYVRESVADFDSI